uniref:Uncharacterized protein n=1 Tax=Rhipicephalus zambeziensis TaxID=60191 RepID=A0A224Y925_9ACAR
MLQQQMVMGREERQAARNMQRASQAESTHEMSIHRTSADCHSSTLKARCSNTKKDARNERTSIHKTSAKTATMVTSCVSSALLS